MKALLPLAAIAALGGLANAQIAFQQRMGEPIQGLNATELAAFHAGQLEFETVLSESDGLGPIFNDSSCAQCHTTPAVGGASSRFVTRFGKAATSTTPFDPLAGLGGSLLQTSAIPSLPSTEVVPPEADVVAHRLTPPMFGAGLAELIKTSDILANELTPPHPNVSGFARMVVPVEGGALRPGRFGWKAGVPTMLTFSADASVNEMGLTNRFFQTENAPNGDLVALQLADTVPDPEDSMIPGQGRIDRQTAFQRYLAPPPQTPRSGMSGELIFDAIGCSACHVSTYVTDLGAEPALSGITIRPYSDYLLHDMGSLGDGIVDSVATEQEMKTAPLWGLVSRPAVLHDGRVNETDLHLRVDSAIQAHDGESAFSRANYNALTLGDQDLLVAFLGSLGRLEFDLESDNDIDYFDWALGLSSLWTGPAPAQAVTPDDPEALADADRDGDSDLIDFMQLQLAFTGQQL